jgi:hypothetical protein
MRGTFLAQLWRQSRMQRRKVVERGAELKPHVRQQLEVLKARHVSIAMFGLG